MEFLKKIKSKKSLKRYNKKQNILSLFQKIQNNFQQTYPKSAERFRKIKSKKTRDKINNYIIGETLGEGAFGKVKLGKHIPTGEKVAIKIITKDLIDINKIKKEIKILQRIKHINIIQLYEIIETKKMDAREIGERFFNKADKILIDAPCSGLGVLRRKADLRWNKNLEEIKKLPKLQIEILKSASRALKIGGMMVYSTCTIEKAENEKVIDEFLSFNKNFKLKRMKTLMPHIDKTDGFFTAKLIREE